MEDRGKLEQVMRGVEGRPGETCGAAEGVVEGREARERGRNRERVRNRERGRDRERGMKAADPLRAQFDKYTHKALQGMRSPFTDTQVRRLKDAMRL